MREQVADRDLRRRIGLGKCEIGIEIADARIPGHDTVADQGRHDGGRQRLGHRGELEDRVRSDRLCLRPASRTPKPSRKTTSSR